LSTATFLAKKMHRKITQAYIQFWVVLITFLALIIPGLALAQSATGPWTDPVNLSKSGSSNDPSIVIDSAGIVHAVWVDDHAGYIYSEREMNQWSPPTPVRFPFFRERQMQPDVSVGQLLPILLATDNGLILSFWFNEEGSLLFSKALAEDFGNALSWETSRTLVDSAVNFAAVADDLGVLHLAYIRSEETADIPAGVYYRQSLDRGASWSTPALLYQNKYIRSLTGDVAHIDISSTTVGESTTVYIAWDDRPLKRTFLTKSSDSGKTWETPREIDGPRSDQSASIPHKIITYPQGDQILALWHSKVEESQICHHYYQFSQDGGATWARQTMLENDLGCPSENRFLQGPDGNVFLWIVLQDEINILVWDGTQWSNSQPQTGLNNFKNPETLSTVNFTCRQPALSEQGQLFVIGCEEGAGGDIWAMSRQIGDTSDWFPPPSLWRAPDIATSVEYQFTEPALTIGTDGLTHLLWSQKVSDESDEEALFYGYLEESWLISGQVVASPLGKAGPPSVTIDANGRLLAVWIEGKYGDIYFSWAVAPRANDPSEWNDPMQLPSLHSVNSSPEILTAGVGEIYVAYAIPVNDDRGIYITRSSDGGETWSDPYQVFDAAAQGWDRVDEPRLTRTNDDRLHMVWTKYNLLNSNINLGDPASLYYAWSDDQGDTWTDPEELDTNNIIQWSEIVSPDGIQVHRLWQEAIDNSSVMWHEVSADGGASWSRTTVFSSAGVENEHISLSPGPSGYLHFVRMTKIREDSWKQEYWFWDRERWLPQESLDLETTGSETILAQVSAYNPNGFLTVGYTSRRVTDEGDEYKFTSYGRELDFQGSPSNPDQTPQPVTQAGPEEPTATPQSLETTPEIEVTPPADLEPTPSPSAVLPTSPPPTQGNNVIVLVVGGLLAVFVVGVGITINQVLKRRS
jgi:hypothetical protein